LECFFAGCFRAKTLFSPFWEVKRGKGMNKSPFPLIPAVLSLFTLFFTCGWVAIRNVQAKVSDPGLTQASPGTVVSGEITQNTTWTAAGSPYQIPDYLVVDAGVTLTIQPNVTVICSQDVVFAVMGTLDAAGSSSQPILITGAVKQPGSWSGIYVAGLYDAPASVNLQYVTIEYGGSSSDTGNLYTLSANVNLSHSTFKNSLTDGIYVDLGDGITHIQIADSSYINNQQAAVHFASGDVNVDPLLSNLTASGNGQNAVVYDDATFKVNQEIEKMGLLTIMKNGFNADASLTIDPGVVLENDGEDYIYGPLTAKGTAALPILITGITKSPGSWNMLYLEGNSSSDPERAVFDYVTIEYGGQPPSTYDNGALVLDQAVVTMTNSVIRYSATNGILSANGGTALNPSLVLDHVQFLNNHENAILCLWECYPQTKNLTASGNGQDTITYNTSLTGNITWDKQSLDYLVQSVSVNSLLTIAPGVVIQFAPGASLEVYGSLVAVGTPSSPIVMTGVGSNPQPGGWNGIELGYKGLMVELTYCDIGYGGGANGTSPRGMLRLLGGYSLVKNSRIHDSASAGIYWEENPDDDAVTEIHDNRIENNAQGFTTASNPSISVDATSNWWGDASGPLATSNPGGKGNPVSDLVLFNPWLTSPSQGEPSDLEMTVAGPARFAPGETVYYSLTYANYTAQTVQNAVVRLALPDNASYVDDTAGGILYPAIRQLFWKLGSVPPKGQGTIAVRVQFDWGVPEGLQDVVAAQISGSNVSQPLFDVTPYLNFSPITLTGSQELTQAQINTERAAYPELDQLITQAEGQGFVFGDALNDTYSDGAQQNRFILFKFQPQFSTMILTSGLIEYTAEVIDGSSVTVGDAQQAVRYTLQSGDWQPTSTNVLDMSVLDMSPEGGISWQECMKNCILEQVPGYVITSQIKSIGAVMNAVDCVKAASGDDSAYLDCSKVVERWVPGYGEAVDLGKCNSDCQDCKKNGNGCNDDKCHCCTSDKFRCDSNDWLYGFFFGIDVVKKLQCYDGKYLAEKVVQVCALCEKCVASSTGVPACVSKGSSSSSAFTKAFFSGTSGMLLVAGAGGDSQCSKCKIPQDPNEMSGPQGELLPGQTVTYTISYENVGAGEADGVFIENDLGGNFDLSSLNILSGNASLTASTGKLFFVVGTLSPNGQPGDRGSVSYSIRLKTGLASGTVIQNQATVFFPTVPQQTPTNTVINIVRPIRVNPQALTTTATQPVAFTLTGQDTGNSHLTFQVIAGPSYGTLTGSLPNLTYTAEAGFSGQDRIRVTASNGTITSQAVDITVDVQPDPNDHSGPKVLWVSPAPGSQVLVSPDEQPALNGMAFLPMIQAQFSKALDPASVTGTTFQISVAGKAVPITIVYDPTARQVIFYMNEVPQEGQVYTVRITGVKDTLENSLAAPYSWTFKVSLSEPARVPIFLPEIVR
jgi:hypothetical protein